MQIYKSFVCRKRKWRKSTTNQKKINKKHCYVKEKQYLCA